MDIVQNLCLDEDELPARRQEEVEDLEMTEVMDNTAGLVAEAVAELGSGRVAEVPYSPVRKEPRGKRLAAQETSKVTMEDKKWLLGKLFCFSRLPRRARLRLARMARPGIGGAARA